MSITDELRTGGIYRFPSNRRVFTEEELTAIADRIDAEHEAACAEAYGNGVMSVPIALDESQWVKLPVDADGETIHVGDVLDGYGKTIEVVELRCGRSGWVLISRDGGGYDDCAAFAHHRAPTVEDVLRDVVKLCHNTWKEESPFHFYDVDDVMKSGNIAEYASRLRLAGDAE